MKTIIKICVALALMVSFANTTLAEFDPIADLSNDDSLLGLDLPTDFEEFDSLEIPAEVEIIAPEPIEETTTPEPAIIPTTAGSGGALSEESEPAPTPAPATIPQSQNSAQSFIAPTPSSYFNTNIASSSQDVSPEYVSYQNNEKAQLTPTGPAATFALALITSIGLAIFFRKKLQNV